jgi:argininosuccinate synthase
MHVTGSVELELRRGDDYSIVDTKAVAATYDAHKLSMERSDSAFTPEDRIGALEMQSISVLDSRALTLHLAEVRKSNEPLSTDVEL